MKFIRLTAALLAAASLPLISAPGAAEPAPPVSGPGETAPASPPKLIVAIAVDQFSADLFAQYRSHFTGGLARLEQGVVFPSGYQSHATTETCPGHSTILTGAHPSRTGVVANAWFDLTLDRKNKKLNCLEDPGQTPQGDEQYVVTTKTLLVPTLGERMKAANPASRNIAVSGKDRGAVMMGGTDTDAIVWWRERGFETLRGRSLDPVAVRQNGKVSAAIGKGIAAYPLPSWCRSQVGPVTVAGVTVGTGQFALKSGDARAFRYTPHLDKATLDIALGLVDEFALGKQAAPDILSVSLSATDYIGHAYGNEGPEMCIQMQQLDASLGEFFKQLDARKIDYAVMLTADHGGFDLVERQKLRGYPDAERPRKEMGSAGLGKAISERMGLKLDGPLLYGDAASGDFFISKALNETERRQVIAEAKTVLAWDPEVAAVYSMEEVAATPMPTTPPTEWTLLERARAAYYPGRSGDFTVFLKRGVVIVSSPAEGYLASHGTPWDYDRRVPILFWRKGLAGFEQPNPVETVDIAPTLAAWLGLAVPTGAFDGRCLDLDGGPGETCGAK